MHSRYKWNILAGHWIIKLGKQNEKLLHWTRGSCVSTQTLEAFVAASSLSAKFDCPVARHKFPLLATVHDFETGLSFSIGNAA